jgi:hypothetical protein
MGRLSQASLSLHCGAKAGKSPKEAAPFACD